MNPTQNILSLIPQRPPIVMIDELLFFNKTSATTAFTIRASNIFVENGFLKEPGLIENIAQTAAARAGYESILSDKEVNRGYIGAINNLNIFYLPKIGECIRTEILIENLIFNTTIISANVTYMDSVIATCKMKIFLSPE